jgi:hypothetical protein
MKPTFTNGTIITIFTALAVNYRIPFKNSTVLLNITALAVNIV